MGSITYDDTPEPIAVDDLTLAHLKVVITTKLRRRESLLVSWLDAAGRQSSIWINPSIALRFTFDDTERPPLDGRWIERLMSAANSTGGLIIPSEAAQPQNPDRAARSGSW